MYKKFCFIRTIELESEKLIKQMYKNIPIILQSKVKPHKVGKCFNDIFFEIVFRKNHFNHNKKSFLSFSSDTK